MADWDPGHYLRFGDERTRPSVDLATRIAVDAPSRVIDLGCGPGNSTQVLARRWPSARVTGLDSSAAMIEAARTAYPGLEWFLGPIETWSPDGRFDVVFSNAALQWVPDHGALVERLFAAVAPGGALAFQIPSVEYAVIRTLIREVATSGPWAPRMSGPLGALTMCPTSFYYDRLAPLAVRLDLWETEYLHVLASPDAVVDWMASTGLRPFVDALASVDDRERFEQLLRARVRETYERRVDGKVLFPFRRTFVIAYA
jgi:trans-aconitate 2-methyltransferase